MRLLAPEVYKSQVFWIRNTLFRYLDSNFLLYMGMFDVLRQNIKLFDKSITKSKKEKRKRGKTKKHTNNSTFREETK